VAVVEMVAGVAVDVDVGDKQSKAKSQWQKESKPNTDESGA